ncbi:putative GTP-binding protein 6 [Liolophura sinensis]|uniref:putative GTP-binding protein 6 n=1 Tax=Liolophura sinensis TaxID=3198878 RepID=UPI0031585EC6
MSCVKLLRTIQSQCSKERIGLKFLLSCGRDRIIRRFLSSAEKRLREQRVGMVWMPHETVHDLPKNKASSGLSFCRLCQLRKLHSSAPVGREESHIDETSENQEDSEESLLEDMKYREFLREYYKIPDTGQRLLVIQPEVKWGPMKRTLTTGELQLAEACALVDSIPNWKVIHKKICKTKSLNTRYIFGRGMLDELTADVRSRMDISAVFISMNMVTGEQLSTLQKLWGIPVYDRYTVVLEIFKEHAKTKEAKLQVALAEIPYLRSRLREIHEGTVNRSAGGMHYIGGSGETYLELRHRLLQQRELKLKKALEKVRNQRQMLRANRARRDLPVVAVVGYTNSGKTSLIKALTGDKSLEPQDQLFATLDVTAHAGVLPNHMTVLYVDTVGFMSDIPTSLIDAFSATLEDALAADAVIHVRDISHPDTQAQRHNVLTTLQSMLPEQKLATVIEVCNKADLLTHPLDSQDTLISATAGLGLRDLLHLVEKTVLEETGMSIRRLKVPMGGSHLR